MEYLIYHQDESDRQYQGLLDISNVAWPDVKRAVEAVRGRNRNVVRVLNIKIKLETLPAR